MKKRNKNFLSFVFYFIFIFFYFSHISANESIFFLSLKNLRLAPRPRAIVATLWVARAFANGRPRKMRAGNCIKPAPPPAIAENAFATKDTIIKTS